MDESLEPLDVTELSSDEFYEYFNDSSARLLYAWSVEVQGPSNDAYRIWLTVAYGCLLVVGLVGNVYVAAVISRVLYWTRRQAQPKASRTIQIYVLALCLSDLIVLTFLSFLLVDLIYDRWMLPLSTTLCRLYLFTESLNKFCGPFLLVALSGYCYGKVCRVNKTSVGCRAAGLINQSHTTVYCLGVVAVCVILVVVLITPVYIYGDIQFLVFFNSDDVLAVTPKCLFEPTEDVLEAFTVYSFICGYVIPAFLFTFFYASILRKAFLQAQKRHRHYRQSGPGRRTAHRRLSRTLRVSIGLVLFYLISITPYWLLFLRQYLLPKDTMYEDPSGVIVSYFVHMLPYINCCGYPILYTALNRNIVETYHAATAGRPHRVRRSAISFRRSTVNDESVSQPRLFVQQSECPLTTPRR